MLAKGPPKRDKNGNIMKDKSGKVVHEPYVIKVLNTINFSKIASLQSICLYTV